MDPAVEAQVKSHLISIEPKLKIVFTVNVDFQSVVKHPYVALVGAILGQRIRYALAKKLRGKFYTLFGTNCQAADVLSSSSSKKLSEIGMSTLQHDILIRVSQHIVDKQVTLDHRGIKSLTCVTGIGSWTVNTTLLTALQDWDIFPDNDYFLKKRLQRLYGLAKMPSARQVREISLKWSPYRSYVCWYLWRWF
jgi:DNA-3-methyladenine glycosylase II